MKIWSKSNNLLLLISILIIFGVYLYISGNSKQKLENENIIRMQNILKNTPILAKSFSIYDNTLKKEIFSKNGNEILPLASLVKIMTVISILDKHSTDEVLVIQKKSSKKDENYSLGLGEKWSIGDLAKFTLVSSSNEGAVELSGIEKNILYEMNKKGKEIGMQNSTFLNFTGLDLDKKSAGSFGKALDVNLMSIYAIEKYPEIFSVTIEPSVILESISGNIHNIKNTNTITEKIPSLLFSKTGFTALAGGNLTLLFNSKTGHIIAITLLGSTEAGRFSDMEKLVEISYNFDPASKK